MRAMNTHTLINVARCAAAAAVAAALGACSGKTCTGFDLPAAERAALVEVAAFPEHQVTGVAVSSRGRVFVNFPRWGGAYAMAVGEVMPDGEPRPFPDESWNAFNDDPRNPPIGDVFVCVQSVHVDDRDRLWVLDPAAPLLDGVVRHAGGGPKLVQIDLASNTVSRVIRFDEAAAPERSYLNDVRVDTRTDTAYVTDSGLGALLVVDLATGATRRVLDRHPATQARPEFVPIIEGREWRTRDGVAPRVHADGLALDARRGWLYFQALTANRLYRVGTRVLTSPTAESWQIDDAVEDLGPSLVTDGMECDRAGNVYFTALEHDAVVRRSPRGAWTTLARDPRIAWPDSLAIGPAPAGSADASARTQRWLYFTTSQIHRTPSFDPGGRWPAEPYRVWRIRLTE